MRAITSAALALAPVVLGCGGGGGGGGGTTTPVNLAPPARDLCTYSGPFADAVLRSADADGAYFGHVSGASGSAEVDLGTGAPRLIITATDGGWTLTGYAALDADAALRTARATQLIAGVSIAPGYQPVVHDGGSGQLELGLPPGAFSEAKGFTFAAPPLAWLPCDQLTPTVTEPSESDDDVRMALGLGAELPRRTLRRDRPVTIRVSPGGAALVTFRAADPEDPRAVAVIVARGEHTRISVVDGGAMIDGWVVADDVEDVGLPGVGFGSTGATGTPYVRCTAAADEPLWLDLPDGGRAQVGTLAAGAVFMVPGRATTFTGPIVAVPPSGLTLRIERAARVTISPRQAPTCS